MAVKDLKYIYGPVPSWRLGCSLGIDPLSNDKKICPFDCVYCQIGKTRDFSKKREIYVPADKITRMSHPLLKFSEGFLLTAFYTASATVSTVVFDSLPSA